MALVNPQRRMGQRAGQGHGAQTPPLDVQIALEQGEEIIYSMRPSPLAPVAQLSIVALGFISWSLLNTISQAVSGLPLPDLVQYGVLGLTLILALRWLYRDALGWYLTWYTVTNRRIVVTTGVLRRSRQEASTARIQSVHVQRSNVVANAFNLGDVQVLTASAKGSVWLRGVRDPEGVAGIMTLMVEGKLGKKPGAPSHAAEAAPDAYPALREALAELAAEEAEEDAEDAADIAEEEARGEDLLAGGLIRRPIDLALLPDERVLARLYRHWFVLLTRLLPGAIITVLIILGLALARRILGSGVTTATWTLMALVALGALIVELLIVSNYVDDVFILTNQRIIDINRTYYIFAEARNETLYRSVQDVAIEVPLLGRYFGYGHLTVQTAGRAPNIEMENMGSPRETQERIFALINADKERRALADRKKARKEMQTSLDTVLSHLFLTAPDVRGLPITTAATRLRAAGLSVVIAGERPSRRYAPGSVLIQTPSPGAATLRGAEVALTISSRPRRAQTP